jgi:Family of unknown function (DUF6527)
MKQPVSFKHEFVQFIPEELQEGTIYVSIRFATVAHLCACGCKTKVVTPLKPTDWKLTFDGKTVSLHPSVGNWAFPCRSHYWIRNNQVQWADDWSDARIEANREYDRQAKDRYFNKLEDGGPNTSNAKPELPEPVTGRTWWKRLWPW